MAIPAVTTIGAESSSSTPRIGELGRIRPVQGIPAALGLFAGRSEGAASGPAAAPPATAAQPRRDADPRRPESLLFAGQARAGTDQARAGHAREDQALGDLAEARRRLAQRNNAQSAEVVRMIELLSARDAEVRAHEAAHVAAGGSYITGGASYTLERGPDGRSYAVGGEVGIDTQPVPGRPEETASKMRIVKAAALAPIDPSAADLAVAAAAASMEAEAMAQAAAIRAEEATRGSEVARRYGEAASPRGPGGSEKRVDMVA